MNNVFYSPNGSRRASEDWTSISDPSMGNEEFEIVTLMDSSNQDLLDCALKDETMQEEEEKNDIDNKVGCKKLWRHFAVPFFDSLFSNFWQKKAPCQKKGTVSVHYFCIRNKCLNCIDPLFAELLRNSSKVYSRQKKNQKDDGFPELDKLYTCYISEVEEILLKDMKLGIVRKKNILIQ